MSYYNSLAFQLRMRLLPEPKVVEILQEVQELSGHSGQDPEGQFGPASAYAEQFPKGKSRSRATRVAILILGIALAVLAIDLLSWFFRDSSLKIGSVPVFPVLVGVQLAAIVGAIIADHRLPSGFLATEGQRN